MNAVSLFFDLGYVPAPYSIYKNVVKINPGEYLKYNLELCKFSTQAYWVYPIRKHFFGLKQGVSQIKPLIYDAIKLRLYSDAKKGIFLSSGADSNILAAVCSQIAQEKVLSYTVGFKDHSSDESECALKNANYLGLDANLMDFDPPEVLVFMDKMFEFFDEPFSDKLQTYFNISLSFAPVRGPISICF